MSDKKNWFQRISDGILTPNTDKKDVPAGLWYKCPKCKKRIPQNEHKDNLKVCSCGYHDNYSPKEYFDILFDTTRYKLYFENLLPKDMLGFTDLKDYPSRIKEATKKSGVNEALQVAVGKINDQKVGSADDVISMLSGKKGMVEIEGYYPNGTRAYYGFGM